MNEYLIAIQQGKSSGNYLYALYGVSCDNLHCIPSQCVISEHTSLNALPLSPRQDIQNKAISM
eukprot:9236651-Ditylum_brightwellii.AAC.1